MTTASRQRILQLFEEHRAVPGAGFDENHFVDFLLPQPKRVGMIRNSFRGLRRFNRFIDDVQYEFGVCFSLKDRESEYSVDRFVERINELRGSRQGSLRSLKNQQKAGAGWNVLILADLVLLGFAIKFRHIVWLAVLLVLAAGILTLAFSIFARNASRYLRRLRSRIDEMENDNVAV